MNGVEVKITPLGQGVFATRSYGPEQCIGRIAGKVVDDPQYGSDYCISLGKNYSLEPAAPFRFLNHSCRPNCELVLVGGRQARNKEVWVEALTTIEPGDELTIDYAWPADSAIPCLCGSPHCRGWIVAADELHALPERPR